MNSSSNASEDSSLLNLLNTAQNSNISEIEINEQFQIFKYEMIKNNFYTLTLSDNKFGFSGFLLNNPKNIEDFKKGKKITIKKIKIKSIGSKLFIIINDYEINSEDSKDIPEIKLLKQKDGNFLDDKENIILNFYNKNNKYNKNQIRNNFSPHSKLELYINKNYSNNINVNKTSLNKLNNNANNISSNFSPTQISWKYSRDTNPISETINSNNICPSKTKIQESTETKNTSQKKYINNKKKEKNERKTKFLSSSVGPLAKKYNNKRNYGKRYN